ncbi:hypothetical protein S245_062809, partial [Arachis hypogaea]
GKLYTERGSICQLLVYYLKTDLGYFTFHSFELQSILRLFHLAPSKREIQILKDVSGIIELS